MSGNDLLLRALDVLGTYVFADTASDHAKYNRLRRLASTLPDQQQQGLRKLASLAYEDEEYGIPCEP